MNNEEYLIEIVRLKNERNKITRSIYLLRKSHLGKNKLKRERRLWKRDPIKDKKMDIISDVICERYEIKKEAIIKKTKIGGIVTPRQLIMYFSSKHYFIGKTYIGKYFNRDHSTVINACKRIQDLMDTESDFMKMTIELSNKIQHELYKSHH